jgi:hypothetical protein
MNKLNVCLAAVLVWSGSVSSENLSNAEMCAIENTQHARVTELLESFKKVCGAYPKNLAQLIDNKTACKKWRAGQGLEDTPKNRGMLAGFNYKRTQGKFILLAAHCPN